MVQAWYQGGISVFDFADSARPRRSPGSTAGPLSADQLILGGSWSAYWYNGFIFSNDIQKGLDVLKLDDERVDRSPVDERVQPAVAAVVQRLSFEARRWRCSSRLKTAQRRR